MVRSLDVSHLNGTRSSVWHLGGFRLRLAAAVCGPAASRSWSSRSRGRKRNPAVSSLTLVVTSNASMPLASADERRKAVRVCSRLMAPVRTADSRALARAHRWAWAVRSRSQQLCACDIWLLWDGGRRDPREGRWLPFKNLGLLLIAVMRFIIYVPCT